MWIDTHCHPFDKQFDLDRGEIFERGRAAGVGKMISVGYNKWANRKALEDAQEHADVWAAVGVHPCDCQDWDGEKEWMREVAAVAENRIIAIGEAGLDYHHMRHPKEEQERVFREQIQLSKELGLPLVVHSRDAGEDTLRILAEEDAQKVILHCFAYGHEVAQQAWDRGYFTAFGGVVTYPKAKDVQAAAENCPLDLLLVETDCPYIATQKHRGKRNEIAYVVEVGEKIARLRGVDVSEIAAASTKNAQQLFEI